MWIVDNSTISSSLKENFLGDEQNRSGNKISDLGNSACPVYDAFPNTLPLIKISFARI